MNSILIKLPNWMGDILFSYDLIYSLCRSFEKTAVCTSHQHSRLLQIFPIPNVHVIDYPDGSWPRMDAETRARIQGFRPEWGLLLPNSVGSALALRRAGVRKLAGYDTEFRGFLLEKSLKPPEQRIHQTEYYLNLIRLFDCAVEKYPIETRTKRGSFVIIHPGASKRERAWNLDRFVQVAEALTHIGKQVMFVSGEELPAFPYPAAIRPSLYEFAGLLKECALFIGNDSGPLHLAQQCGAPVVGIYGPGDPNVTGPRPATPSRVIYHSFPCSPCRQRFFRECDPAPTGKPFCIETIATQEVFRAALELLDHPGAKAQSSGG
ncbi:MAG TPA: glycosyltransferase family 9 protein [Acidobacteriota bacterium]|nr:glycosyltransferase family 9 protein [Acidobacteriota bacterium]